jgi:hypothetical protein
MEEIKKLCARFNIKTSEKIYSSRNVKSYYFYFGQSGHIRKFNYADGSFFCSFDFYKYKLKHFKTEKQLLIFTKKFLIKNYKRIKE